MIPTIVADQATSQPRAHRRVLDESWRHAAVPPSRKGSSERQEVEEAMMRLIGLLDSPYVRRVAISLDLMGLPFRHERLSVFRNYDAFSGINPVVKAPTFVTSDGVVLMDSSLILDHLEQLAPPGRRLSHGERITRKTFPDCHWLRFVARHPVLQDRPQWVRSRAFPPSQRPPWVRFAGSPPGPAPARPLWE